MPIQPTAPIVIPAAAQKTADGVWITSLNIVAPDATNPIRVQITVAPFVTATGEILKPLQKTIILADLNAAATTAAQAGDNTLADAVTAIYAAVQSIVTTQKTF